MLVMFLFIYYVFKYIFIYLFNVFDQKYKTYEHKDTFAKHKLMIN